MQSPSAANAIWLSLACFCVGALAATVHVIVPLSAHLVPPKERGRIVGTVLSGLLIGVLLARTFSGVVGAQYGWRTVYWFASALMLGLALAIRMSLEKSRPETSMKWTELMRSVYSLAPEARSRINTFYMVAFFLGGSLGSYLGPLGFNKGGWTGFCAIPLAALLFALVYFIRGRM